MAWGKANQKLEKSAETGEYTPGPNDSWTPECARMWYEGGKLKGMWLGLCEAGEPAPLYGYAELKPPWRVCPSLWAWVHGVSQPHAFQFPGGLGAKVGAYVSDPVSAGPAAVPDPIAQIQSNAELARPEAPRLLVYFAL